MCILNWFHCSNDMRCTYPAPITHPILGKIVPGVYTLCDKPLLPCPPEICTQQCLTTDEGIIATQLCPHCASQLDADVLAVANTLDWQPENNQQSVDGGFQYDPLAAEETMSHTGYSESSSSDDYSPSPPLPPSRKRQKLPAETAKSTQKGTKASKSAARSSDKTMDQPMTDAGHEQSQTPSQRKIRQPKSRQPKNRQENAPTPLQTMAADLRASEPSLSSSIPALASDGESQQHPYGAPAPILVAPPETSLGSSFPHSVTYVRNQPSSGGAYLTQQDWGVDLRPKLNISSTDLLLGRANFSQLRPGKRLKKFLAGELANRPPWLDPTEQVTVLMPNGQVLPTVWLAEALRTYVGEGEYYFAGLEIGDNATIPWPLFKEGPDQYRSRQQSIGLFISEQDTTARYRRWTDDPTLLPEFLPLIETNRKRRQMREAAERAASLLQTDNIMKGSSTQWSTAQGDTADLTSTAASQEQRLPTLSIQYLLGALPMHDHKVKYPSNTSVPVILPPETKIFGFEPKLKTATPYELKKPRPDWLEAKEWCIEHPSNGQVVPSEWVLHAFDEELDMETYYQRGLELEDNVTLLKPLLGESVDRFKGRHSGVDGQELIRLYATWKAGKYTDPRWVPKGQMLPPPVRSASGASGPASGASGPASSASGPKSPAAGPSHYQPYRLTKTRPSWLSADEICTKHPSNGQVIPQSWLTVTTDADFADGLSDYYQRGRQLENNETLEKPLLGETLVQFKERIDYIYVHILEKEYKTWTTSVKTERWWVPKAEDTTPVADPAPQTSGASQAWPVYNLTRRPQKGVPKGGKCTVYPKNGQVVPISWLTSTEKLTNKNFAEMVHVALYLEDNDVLEMPWLGETADQFIRRFVKIRRSQHQGYGVRDPVASGEMQKWRNEADEKYRSWAADPENQRFLPAAVLQFIPETGQSK